MEKDEVSLKILVVGEPSVGKTSFVQRYCRCSFSTEYKTTIGVDFSIKRIEWNINTNLNLTFWDLAGQSRLNTQIKAYYRKTDGVICVCDITRPETTNEVIHWRNLIFENCVTDRGIQVFPPIILLVNKIDLVDEKDLIGKMANFIAASESIGAISCIPISVKTDIGIDDAIKTLISEILKRRTVDGELTPAKEEPGKIKLNHSSDQNRRCC